MSATFLFDVFLSHSSKDKDVVRSLAHLLRNNGLRVWFDEWEIRPGDNIPVKIEEGLELSKNLVLCMSVNAFGSDWATLETNTFRFRDPLNKERRFIPLRLDTTPIKGSLAQFHYVNWLPPQRELEYSKILDSCKHSNNLTPTVIPGATPPSSNSSTRYQREHKPTIWVIGSYNELQLPEVTLIRKLVVTLGSGLAARRICLVSGKSDMLNELAAHCRNTAMSLNPRGPLPVILDGKLRQTDLIKLFIDTIGRMPDLAIVMGGGVSRGRVAEECAAADDAGIPVFPVYPTGGAATQNKLTAVLAQDLHQAMLTSTHVSDVNDVIATIFSTIERYLPSMPPY